MYVCANMCPCFLIIHTGFLCRPRISRRRIPSAGEKTMACTRGNAPALRADNPFTNLDEEESSSVKLSGWWFQLLCKILVHWDDYSQHMEQ